MSAVHSMNVFMPAAFNGHGNPMNFFEVYRYTTASKAFGKAVPRPRVILVAVRTGTSIRPR